MSSGQPVRLRRRCARRPSNQPLAARSAATASSSLATSVSAARWTHSSKNAATTTTPARTIRWTRWPAASTSPMAGAASAIRTAGRGRVACAAGAAPAGAGLLARRAPHGQEGGEGHAQADDTRYRLQGLRKRAPRQDQECQESHPARQGAAALRARTLSGAVGGRGPPGSMLTPMARVVTRCGWCGTDPLYVSYHDEEWGVPVHDDRKLFEFLILEGAQAGLSWLTIAAQAGSLPRGLCRLRCRARRTLQCPQSGAAPAQPGHRPKPAQSRIGGQERPGLPARAGRVREFRGLPMAFRRWAAATESPASARGP